MARLAARQERRRKAGKLSDTGSTSENSLFPEGRLVIDEAPAKEVEVETSLPGKSPRVSQEARGRASGSERSPSGDRSGPARPYPARGSGKKKGSKSSSSSSRRAESGREGGTKHSSSASSSHKKKKSSSSSSGDAMKRARDRSRTGPRHNLLFPAPQGAPGLRPRSRPLPSPPRVLRTPVPSAPVAASVIPVDPRTPVPSASRPALGPGNPAGGSLPALPLPQQWQMQLYQLQAMQQAMASVAYTFPGQHPFQPPGFGAGDVFGPASISQSSAPAPSVAKADHPTRSADFGHDPPPDLSPEEWEMVRRLRQGGGGMIGVVLPPRHHRDCAPRCRRPMSPTH